MRYILFIFLIHSINGQCLDLHLYADPAKKILVSTHVDSFNRINDYLFYQKGNKLYCYSYNSGTNHFIDWNVSHFSLGPDETMVYKKGSSFNIHRAPYKGQGKHIAWNVSNYKWTIDGTLIFKKFSNSYILHNKFKDKPKLISSNIKRWLLGCGGEIAYIKQGNLYFIDNKVKGSKISIQTSVQNAFFVNGTLYFMKSDSLWVYSAKHNKKERMLYQVQNYYICGEELYINTRKGVYIVSGTNLLFTGHSRVSQLKHCYRGISYIFRGRLYFISKRNVVDICSAPSWYSFSDNGCLYLYTNNKLCYLDKNHQVNTVLEEICSPSYSNRRIYYTQKSRRYYLEPALGKIVLCK